MNFNFRKDRNIITLTILIFLLLLLFLISCKPVEKKHPNVLFIAVDDLRPAIRCFGDSLAITPNIDNLFKHGVIFDRAFVQAPSCAPSRTSMLTGLRPDEVKVTNHKTHFRDTRPEVVTLPQFFRSKGYTSINLGKIFHYKTGYNDSISWDKEYFLKGDVPSYVLSENREAKGKGAATECVDVNDTAYADGKIANMAVKYLKQFKENNSQFFLGVGHLKPHLPFCAPKKYWDLYHRDDFGYIPNRKRPENAPDLAFHKWQELRGYNDIPAKGPLTHEKEKELRHAYYASVSYVDAQIGKVLDALDELGLRDNTIIVLWGDHGYHLGEQNQWCKSTNFNIAARSPILISAPGQSKEGATSHAIVESLDIYPTVIDLCGFEPKGELSGVSLRPLLENPDSQWKNIAFNQFARPYKAAIGAKVAPTHMGYSVRVDGWRYISWYNYEKSAFEFPELYSFSKSRLPAENLAGNPEYTEIESRLFNLIKDYKEGRYKK